MSDKMDFNDYAGRNSPQEAIAEAERLREEAPDLSQSHSSDNENSTIDLESHSAKYLFSGPFENDPPSIQTFDALDLCLGGGLEPGTFTAICASPGTGKTSLAANILCNAKLQGELCPSALFSLEMGKRSIRRLFLAIETGFARNVLKDPKNLSEENQKRLENACADLSKIPFWSFYDKRDLGDIEPVIYQLADEGCRLVVIDYLGLIRVEEAQNEYETIGIAAERLTALAVETDMALVVLGQVRKPDKNKNEEIWIPTLWDGKGNGAFVAAAHNVICLGVEEVGSPNNSMDRRLHCAVRKAREGPGGEMTFRFERHCGRIIPETYEDNS